MQTKPLSLAIPVSWLVLVAAFWFLLLAPARQVPRRGLDGGRLRSIGQAGLIYAADNHDKFPVAESIWGYAVELARGGGLHDASAWLVDHDPAQSRGPSRPETVLGADMRGVEPRFLDTKPSWAVPLGELSAAMPETTPIGWTRGLRRDGTWAPHGPYGEDGGYVVFLAGNVRFYRDVKDKLERFDGKGTTGDILEALPPGTRIGEYEPSAAEQLEWPAIKQRRDRNRALWRASAPVLFGVVWAGVLLLMVRATIRQQVPGWVWGVFFLMHLVMAAMYLPVLGKVR
jgi:hypothetical protein